MMGGEKEGRKKKTGRRANRDKHLVFLTLDELMASVLLIVNSVEQ